MGLSENGQKRSELEALYQEVILEHSKHPRFKCKPNAPCICLDGKNPSCGDTIKLFCQLDKAENQTHPNLSLCFEGSGCSISQASASIMCELARGTPLAELRKLIQQAEDIYTGKAQPKTEDLETDVEALYGVSKFPVRIKCAALPWKTLEVLLNEHFSQEGLPRENKNVHSEQQQGTKRLKIVNTEDL